MKFLIDTNILLPLEPTREADLEAESDVVAELARLASESGSQLYLHPAQIEEVRRDRDSERRRLREFATRRYPILIEPPPISAQVEQSIGVTHEGTNDFVDNLLLTAVFYDAVDFLVTHDREVQKKAVRLGVRERVGSAEDAVASLRALFDTLPTPPPAVLNAPPYTLNESDPYFDTLRADYGPEFDAWLRKAKREHRQTWVIRGAAGELTALCIVKKEEDPPSGLDGPVLKVCTFKVAEDALGRRFGELLLKTLFQYARENHYGSVFLTAYEKRVHLLDFLDDFGFYVHPERTKLNELTLCKHLRYTSKDAENLDALEFHVRFGPGALSTRGARAYVVPIRPSYHRLLFPEFEVQGDLLAGGNSFGNSLRKAYLCHSSLRKIGPGSLLLFYRSKDAQAVAAIGVAEGTLISQDPNEIARFVAKRTVYNMRDIEGLCSQVVLAIRFRQDRILTQPIPLHELREAGLLRAAPQSIVEVQEDSTEWIQQRIRQ